MDNQNFPNFSRNVRAISAFVGKIIYLAGIKSSKWHGKKTILFRHLGTMLTFLSCQRLLQIERVSKKSKIQFAISFEKVQRYIDDLFAFGSPAVFIKYAISSQNLLIFEN